jgi:hypothetical protein
MYTDGVSTVWVLDTGEPDENTGGDNGEGPGDGAGGDDPAGRPKGAFDGTGTMMILIISIIVLMTMCVIGLIIGKRKSD